MTRLTKIGELGLVGPTESIVLTRVTSVTCVRSFEISALVSCSCSVLFRDMDFRHPRAVCSWSNPCGHVEASLSTVGRCFVSVETALRRLVGVSVFLQGHSRPLVGAFVLPVVAHDRDADTVFAQLSSRFLAV